jgi:hypothetical protein
MKTPAEFRAARLALGLSIAGAARALGVNESDIRSAENRRRKFAIAAHFEALEELRGAIEFAARAIESQVRDYSLQTNSVWHLISYASDADMAEDKIDPDENLPTAGMHLMACWLARESLIGKDSDLPPIKTTIVYFDRESFDRFRIKRPDTIEMRQRWAREQSSAVMMR